MKLEDLDFFFQKMFIIFTKSTFKPCMFTCLSKDFKDQRVLKQKQK